MKNFTKQNFKTSPVWIRLLIMAFMLLVGAGNVWAAAVTFKGTEYLYVTNSQYSWWNGDNAYTGLYFYGSNGNAWSETFVALSQNSRTAFKVPAGTWTHVIIVRKGSNTKDWNNKYNQSGDIPLESAKNHITKFTEGSGTATWGTYKPTSTGKLTASSASVNTNTNVTLTPSLASNTTYNEIKSTSYAISPSTGASVSGNTFTATAAGTYTVTATITYNPRGYSSLTSTATATTTITVKESCITATLSWASTFDGSMKVGDEVTTPASLDNAAAASSISYTSSNPDVISVNGTTLTALKSGKATITASATKNTGYCDIKSITKEVTVTCDVVNTEDIRIEVVCTSGDNPSIWAWEPNNGNNNLTGGNWPGQAMTPEGNNVYSWETKPTSGESVSIIISKNGGNQTNDIDGLQIGKRYKFSYDPNTKVSGSNDRYVYQLLEEDCLDPACTPPTITLSNNEVTYNGMAQKPTFNGVTPTKVTYNDTELANGPTDAGTYTVKVWANASGDFCEVVGEELTDKFVIKQKAPSAGDFTYTASKPYIGSPVSADVAWGTGKGTGNITTYYKVKDAADNTYTTTQPTIVDTYIVAVTTTPGGNYAATTEKIPLGEFKITKINQTTELKISNQQKELCESPVTLTTSGGSGEGAVSYALSDNTAGATINNDQLTATQSGSVTVVATKAADNNYNAATSKGVTFTFNLLSAPTFSESTSFVCNNVPFDLNTHFSRNNGNNGTLEWYKEEDDTKVQDPTNVSISKTTEYYAILKDGSCYSGKSSLVTAKINTPTISNIVITKESPTSISVTATITGEDLALGLVEYVFDERGMDWSFASSNRGAVVDNKFSCIINNLTEGRAYKIRVGANTRTCSETFVYSDEHQITTDCATYPAPAITTSDIVCPNTNVTLSNYDNGVANVLWYSDAECNTRVNSAVKVAGETKYFARTQIGSCYSNVAILTLDVVKAPQVPTVTIVEGEVITCNETSIVQRGKIKITNYNANYDYIIGDNDNSPVNVAIENGEAYIYFDFGAAAFTLKAKEKTCGLFSEKSAPFEITESDNAPVITGNTSFQPNGSTTLTSDKGASTTWVALDGGDITDPKTNPKTGTSIEFTAKENGTYHVQATYNGCSTIVEIKVQDDLYVWMRRPIKKETAYTQFYHEDQNSSQGGDLYYLDFASKPNNYQDYNHGGVKAEKNCTDKEGYMWYGFKISKTAIENEYYFTVHAPNDGGKKGDSGKWGGFYTHTKVTRFDKDMTSDLYFVMDEEPSGSSEGWNINAPVVVRASGDAKFNANNFADFVPLYVKDANICGKEVVSFEWQKSDSENGTYNTYKSGKGINNIRTREAGWYRCVVTYGDGQGTATSNAIQVTNTTSDTPGTLADFSSKLPVIMVNTNGVGFPSDKNLATKNTNCASGKRYPSLYADDLKEKVTVDVIIKKGNEILYDRKARMNYRGSSSLNFKKKSYAFCSAQDSCVFDKGRHDYVKTKKEKMLNLLGDENYKTSDKDWVLYAATPDPSMMRNRLAFDLYQQMRPNEWGVHSTYVELIVDGEYRGVYVFMDKITQNDNRVKITSADGFIVKFDKTDVVDRVENKDGDQKTFATSKTGTKGDSNGLESYGACIDQRFEIEYPEKDDFEDVNVGSWEPFTEKVKEKFEAFETALEKKDYTTVRALIDYDSWADWFILTEFMKNQDGFRASCIFVYNGDKIEARPLWDQELSFNNGTRVKHGIDSPEGLLITTSSVYEDSFKAPFWFTGGNNSISGGLLSDPCFVSLVKEKWATYTADGGVLTSAKINPMVDDYEEELGDAKGREATRWPYNEATRGTTTDGDYIGYYNFTGNNPEGNSSTASSFVASRNAIKSWVSSRSTNLEANSGLGKAINALEGEALIFTITPSVEVTPWQIGIINIHAPAGYTYTVDFSQVENAGGYVTNDNDTYSVKLPRPINWTPGGNGSTTLSKTYTVTAKLELDSEENTCGFTSTENTKDSVITLKDETEECDPEVTR